jgi:hypothetical protein
MIRPKGNFYRVWNKTKLKQEVDHDAKREREKASLTTTRGNG